MSGHEMIDKISVCIRVRPLNDREKQKGHTSVWRTTNNTIYQCNVKTGQPMSVYTFDHVYDSTVSTQCIYEQVAKGIVVGAVEGYNGTIFAYGQTSSGKTYTMKGNDGIIYQSIQQVFDTIQQTSNRQFLVRVSYLEIYNEVIRDLLEPDANHLKIHEDLQRGIFVGNLTEHIVTSPQQIIDHLENGEKHRHFGSTMMNDKSSRSHTIFRLVIESRRLFKQQQHKQQEEEAIQSAVRVSTLNLVDLAGSERASHTMADGIRLVEGNHINRSLLTLGTVIGKLSENCPHIPYRDSKLTRILQTALGGNSRTAIICAVTPASAHVEETHSTLKFASRAKSITNQAHINEIINDQNLIQKLRREAHEWQVKYEDQLQSYESLVTNYEELKLQMMRRQEQEKKLLEHLQFMELKAQEQSDQIQLKEQQVQKQLEQKLNERDQYYELKLQELKTITTMEKEEIMRGKLESERELREHIERLESDNGQYLVDSTPQFIRLDQLQKENERLKHENEQLKSRMNKRKRRGKSADVQSTLNKRRRTTTLQEVDVNKLPMSS